MFEKIKAIILEISLIDEDAITPDAKLREDLEMSSLDLINLAVEIEKAFGIKVSDKQAVTAHTVDDIVSLIENAVNA